MTQASSVQGPGTFSGDRRSPLGTRLAELMWFRSLTGPHHPFVVSARNDRIVTFGSLRRSISRWAALLDDLVVPPGATVGIAVTDPIDFTLAFLGVMAAGRVAAPFDPRATDNELAATFGRVSPVVVIADRMAPPGTGEWVVIATGSFELTDPDPDPLGSRVLGATVDPESPPGVEGSIDGVGGLLLSTSGTTGAPKLIVLREDQLLHAAGAVAAHHQLSVADRGFCPLPLFHVNAEVVGLLASLVAGATMVLDDRFHRSNFWALMARHHITWINAVPAILARLVPLADGEQVPRDIRFARSASAPLPLAVLDRFEQETGIGVVETYGMTEAASQITANPVAGMRKRGSVGVPVAAEVRVVIDTDDRGSNDETPPSGHVQIRGPSVIRSYAAPGHEDRFTDGWLTTGDLGYFDEDGYLFLVGRVDDVINRGGEKILPREVEEVILADPSVVETAVVGWNHEVLGRVPVAYVVIEGVSSQRDRATAEEVVRRLQARCAGLLSKPKRPVAFHVVERLAAGPTGKVRRNAVSGDSSIYSLSVS